MFEARRKDVGQAAARAAAPRRASRRRTRISDVTETYEFLRGLDVSPDVLARASRVARRWQSRPHDVLVALGSVSAESYASALAHSLGIELVAMSAHPSDPVLVIDALAYRPEEVASIVAIERERGSEVKLGLPPVRSRGMRQTQPSPEDALDEATHGLRRRRPGASAAAPMWLWQRLALVTGIGLLAGGAAVAPRETIALLLALLAFPFVLVTVLRALAVLQLAFPGRAREAFHETTRLPDEMLPIYSVLVPLYDEAEVVGDLVAALAALDYPAEKLDILILVEASDTTTRVRLNAEPLPPHVQVLVVPGGKPQTKPRALNFALQYARGDFIVVYDAEDVPEPDQLRRAFNVLRGRPEQIGCVQARLNIHNMRESWLTRGIA